MAKAGRIKTAKSKRNRTTKEGQGRMQRDHGTSEAQAKRALAVGAEPFTDLRTMRVDAQGKDVTLASSALGQLLARGGISGIEYQAASRYAGLHSNSYGRANPQTPAYGETRGGGAEDMGEDYFYADEALRASGGKREVQNVAVYDRYPPWLKRRKVGRVREADERRDKELQGGLSALVRHFGLSRRAA